MQRKIKEKRQHKKTSERLETDVDISEGIPDVSDLNALLLDQKEEGQRGIEDVRETNTEKEVTKKIDTEEKDEDHKKQNDKDKFVNDTDKCVEIQKDLSEEQVGDVENVASAQETQKNSVEDQSKETTIETMVHVNEKKQEVCKGAATINDGESEKTVTDKDQKETDVDMDVMETTCKVEVSREEGPLYPDLSEQLQQFMLENEKAIMQTSVDKIPVLQASYHEERADNYKITDSKPVELSSQLEPNMTQVRGSAPSETDLHSRSEEYLKPTRTKVAERREELQPLTQDQLMSLYYNVRLENNATFIEKFVQKEMQRENHEFYEILMSYQRARKHLLHCEAALKSYEDDYRKSQNEVWVTEMKTETVKGTCGDNANCTTAHTYEQCKLDFNALSRMTLTLKNIQDQIHEELALHSYSVQLSKLQVESYIHDLFVSCPALRDIPRNLPVFACERQNPNIAHQIQRLQDCISILFTFHRLPIDDEEMVKNLQQWTERMISALLRVGTFEDHLYVLNQIMRCPSGIGTWAAHFVQTPPIPTNEDFSPLMFGNAHLDHAITCLSTALIPTSYRSEFMCKMQKMLTTGKDNKSLSWVMVDSDGEEDEDPQSAWVYLHENDIVAVLRQIPLAAIFRHIFFITQSQTDDSYEYDIQKTTESTMYRVFAFSTCLIRILGNGLRTYSMSRYRQLNKRLGRMIRQCVQFVSEHWENFRDYNQGVLSALSLQKLQVEFDAFFLRAVNFIHMSQRLGSWQFIADMPFDNVSKDTMWKILWLLHQGHGQSFEICDIPSAQECIDFVRDPSSRSQLSDILQRVPVSEGIYLLNTMTNMTESCSSADVGFIETVTIEVFEVSYLCTETRDFCSKMGRELLSAVVMRHPFMLSLLTQRIYEYMDQLGQMGLYLYKGLSMETWLPSEQDLSIIRQWLLNSALGTPPHLMAQTVLSNINWGSNSRGDRLMVPWQVHKQVAVLIVEAYQKFIHGKHLGSMIMEGVKQVSAAVQQYMTVEQEFNSWCWETLLKLSLHRGCLPQDDHRFAFTQGEPPDVNSDDSLLPLCKGIKDKNPAACYVTLMLTRYGHGIGEFISDGVQLLQVLTEQGLFKPTLNAIFYTVEMFVDNQKYLLDSTRFQEVLLAVLRADESYFKVIKGLLSYDFPGPITKLFTTMIQSQVENAYSTTKGSVIIVIGLWSRLLLKIPKWYLDSDCCYVLDRLIMSAFIQEQALQGLQGIFLENYKDFCNSEKRHGVVSSLVNWMTSGVTLPTFLDKSSCSEFSWLAYMILWLEGNFENETKLWSTLQEEMLMNTKAGADPCLKKAIMRLKLDQAPVCTRLTIYRWAQQALDMPVEHPVAPLVWQRFFVLFLGRMSLTQSSLPQRASVGERFFTGYGYGGMLKKLKKKLGQMADHYTRKSGDTSDEDEEISQSKKELCCKLVGLYQTLQLWVEEPLLHDATLYLPSLPPQYQPERLQAVFQNQVIPWLEFIDFEELKTSLFSCSKDWLQTSTQEQNRKSKEPKELKQTKVSAAERILNRLERGEEPLPPPPIYPLKAPVPEVSPMVMEDKGAILHLLESDLSLLREYAGQFCVRLHRHKLLDDKYIDLVPDCYKNVRNQVTVQLKCTSMVNPFHKCTKPLGMIIWVGEKWNDPIKQRQADENRADYKQLVIECRLPPSQNTVICAVHTENAITLLVKLARSTTDVNRSKTLNSIACSLFFKLADLVNPSVTKYPPTKQFFASCIDVLGKEFIQNDPSQTEAVLQMALERCDLGGYLAPHFKPALSPAVFVKMYGTLVEVLQEYSFDQKGSKRAGRKECKVELETICMLLTKFEMKKWLSEYNPSKQEVKKLVEHLSMAFIACGPKPKDGFETLFKIYLSHQKSLLHHRFPLYLHEVLAALLQGSSLQRICVECWEVLQNSCFCGNQNIADQNPMLQEMSTDLSIEEIRNILLWLGHEFMQIRINQKEATTFGIYPKWRQYIPYLAAFMRDLCKCLVDKMVPNLADTSSNEGIESIWRTVTESYAPWIQTLTVKKVVSHPWIAEDRDYATHMMKGLTQFVGYAHFKTADVRGRFYNDFLSLLWLYFAAVLCKADVLPDVVSVFSMEFAQLPWQQLFPNVHVMESMAGLKEHGCSLGFNLVADIVAMINWPQVTAWYESQMSLEGKARYEGCLFVLLIQAFAEKKYIENPDVQQLLTQAQTYRWKHLLARDFMSACSWLMQSCDPKCLLQGRMSPEALGLRVLESAAGFNTEVSLYLDEEWRSKRLSYLHCLSSLICQCTYLTDWDSSQLTTFIINLLTETETVEAAVPDQALRQEECTCMMKEILSLLNNSNPGNQGSEVILAAILDWLQGSPKTILLSPCIHAASRNLASLSYMARIVEQCVQLAFVSPQTFGKTSDPWMNVLGVLQIPELSLTDFYQTCLQESSFLLLHCSAVQRLPFCQSLSEEQATIEMFLDWTEHAKPSSENESKLLLWWHKALELILRQIDYGRDGASCVYLVKKFVHKVQGFGGDRASVGLLGAIGLGKKSPLSEKFRLCCRSLVAFCSSQILSDTKLRLSPSDPASVMAAAKQDLANLLSLKTNKKYQPIKMEIEMTCDFVTDQSKCFGDVIALLKLLKGRLYQDKEFLSVI